MKETLSSAKKGDFEPQEKSRCLCLPNEIKFASSLLKLWKQLNFIVKSITFYILGKHHPRFFQCWNVCTTNRFKRKERIFHATRKQSMRCIIDFKMQTLFPLKFASFMNGWTASMFTSRCINSSFGRKIRIMSLWAFNASATNWGPWASADKMIYAPIYRGPLDQMTNVKMITITEDKSLKEDK